MRRVRGGAGIQRPDKVAETLEYARAEKDFDGVWKPLGGRRAIDIVPKDMGGRRQTTLADQEPRSEAHDPGEVDVARLDETRGAMGSNAEVDHGCAALGRHDRTTTELRFAFTTEAPRAAPVRHHLRTQMCPEPGIAASQKPVLWC